MVTKSVQQAVKPFFGSSPRHSQSDCRAPFAESSRCCYRASEPAECQLSLALQMLEVGGEMKSINEFVYRKP